MEAVEAAAMAMERFGAPGAVRKSDLVRIGDILPGVLAELYRRARRPRRSRRQNPDQAVLAFPVRAKRAA